MIDLIQTVGTGILVGFVYALLGLCIVIIYRASETFNFAIGQFLAIGSFLFYTMFAALNLPLLIAMKSAGNGLVSNFYSQPILFAK